MSNIHSVLKVINVMNKATNMALMLVELQNDLRQLRNELRQIQEEQQGEITPEQWTALDKAQEEAEAAFHDLALKLIDSE